MRIEIIEFGVVMPNPRVSPVQEGIKLCKENNIGFILAVSSSVIDSVKAIAAGTNDDGDVQYLFDRTGEVKDCQPIGTVLTLPAAGSEEPLLQMKKGGINDQQVILPCLIMTT